MRGEQGDDHEIPETGKCYHAEDGEGYADKYADEEGGLDVFRSEDTVEGLSSIEGEDWQQEVQCSPE